MHVIDGTTTVEPLNPTVAQTPPDPNSDVKNDVENISNIDRNLQDFNLTSGRFLLALYAADYG